MEFKKIQKEILKTAKTYSQKYNIDFDDNFAMMKLYEELGELSQAYLIYKKKCRPEKFMADDKSKKKLAAELADVVGISIVLARLLNIDLEEALDKKWITKEWIK